MEQTFLTVFGIVILLLLSPFYLLPSILAYKGKHEQKVTIIAANIGAVGLAFYGVFSGAYIVGIAVSLVGYLVLFGWAIKGENSN